MANHVKRLRKEAELELSQLRKMTGLSITSLWKIENGKIKEDNLKWSTVKRISLALNKKIEEVFF